VRQHHKQLSSLILLLAVLLGSRPALSQSLDVRVEGDRLRIAAPRLRLLTGVPLQRLRDGASVNYIFELSVLNGRAGALLGRTLYRFVISYDIFQETFQVSRVEPTTRVLSHLSMSAAEAACIDAIEIPTRSLPADTPFWIRLEYRAEDMSKDDETGTSLGILVDIFSRKTERSPVSGVIERGPLRLRDLPRVTPRGTTNP